MIDIKIYGIGTSEHEYLKQKIKYFLDSTKTPYLITDERSVDMFISKSIESIPAVEVNGHLIVKNSSPGIDILADKVCDYLVSIISVTK